MKSKEVPVSIFDRQLSKVETLIANSDYENGVPKAHYTTELHLEQLNQYIMEHNLLREDMLDIYDKNPKIQYDKQYKFWLNSISWLEMKIGNHKEFAQNFFAVELDYTTLDEFIEYKPILSELEVKMINPLMYNQEQLQVFGGAVASSDVTLNAIRVSAFLRYDRTRVELDNYKPMTQAETNVIMQLFKDNPRIEWDYNHYKRITASKKNRNAFRVQKQRWFDRMIASREKQKEIFNIFFLKCTQHQQSPKFKDLLAQFGFTGAVNTHLYIQVWEKFKTYWYSTKTEYNVGLLSFGADVRICESKDTDYDDLTNKPSDHVEVNDTYQRKIGERLVEEIIEDYSFDKEFLKGNPQMAHLVKEMQDSRLN